MASGPHPGRALSTFHVGQAASSTVADPLAPCQREREELETQTGWLGGGGWNHPLLTGILLAALLEGKKGK